MILVDTSVWADHLRSGDPELEALLDAGQVLMHPFVIGELALGHLRQRRQTLRGFHGLPEADIASADDVLLLMETASLAGSGVGYVDAHLLASAKLSRAALWARDKRLSLAASRLGVAHTRH